MDKLKLVLVFHCHQPVGNHDHVFEAVYRVSYGPLLDVLAKSGIKFGIHYTGPLLLWLEKNKPDYLERLKEVVESGRAEVLGGSFWESILSVWREKDSLFQLERMNSYLQDKFGIKPRGMWLAERIWEQFLPAWIVKVGIDYTLVDDWHFKMAGLKQEDLKSYFLTEHEGEKLAVFPIDQNLRYMIPYATPDEIASYLKQLYDSGVKVALMGDDGEKFGAWPGTYEHVYENGWFMQFFDKVNSLDFVEFATPSEVLDTVSAAGYVYLPNASYYEMTEWAQPAPVQRKQEEFQDKLKEIGLWEEYKTFVKGGFWRNFFVKYPESNDIHKRVIQVSKLLDEVGVERFERDDLLAAQCNCAYWHGLFGGVYVTHLRNALWQNLARAEKRLAVRQVEEDIDCDGKKEVQVKREDYVATLKPARGGAMFELLDLNGEKNWFGVVSRRYEAYHDKVSRAVLASEAREVKSIHDLVLAKEKGLERYLTYDWHRRVGFVDHVLHPSTTLDTYAAVSYGEQSDFTIEPFEYEFRGNELILWRNGHVWVDDKFLPTLIAKHFKFNDGGFEVEYKLQNTSNQPIEYWFGVETTLFILWDMPLIAGENSYPRNQKWEVRTTELKAQDIGGEAELKFRLSQEALLWHFPVWVVSMSEAGFEKNLQGNSLLWSWRFMLNPYEDWKVRFEVGLKGS